jgi:hypothetical protein
VEAYGAYSERAGGRPPAGRDDAEPPDGS